MRKLIYIATIVSLLLPNLSTAQCKRYAKKTCKPMLEDYTHNGQLNTALLYAGDNAELMLTFYSGQKYRLLVCSMEELGDVSYIIKDAQGNKVYQSPRNAEKTYFDFKVASTQQLVLQVNVPEADDTVVKDEHGLEHAGCVAIMVGFKE